MTEVEMIECHHQLNGRVWVNSGSWWCTGRPGMLWSMGLQRVGYDWVTELNWTWNQHNWQIYSPEISQDHMPLQKASLLAHHLGKRAKFPSVMDYFSLNIFLDSFSVSLFKIFIIFLKNAQTLIFKEGAWHNYCFRNLPCTSWIREILQ